MPRRRASQGPVEENEQGQGKPAVIVLAAATIQKPKDVVGSATVNLTADSPSHMSAAACLLSFDRDAGGVGNGGEGKVGRHMSAKLVAAVSSPAHTSHNEKAPQCAANTDDTIFSVALPHMLTLSSTGQGSPRDLQLSSSVTPYFTQHVTSG